MNGTTVKTEIERLSGFIAPYQFGANDLDNYDREGIAKTIESLETFAGEHSTDPELFALCGLTCQIISDLYVARGHATPNIPRDHEYYASMNHVRGLIEQIKGMNNIYIT